MSDDGNPLVQILLQGGALIDEKNGIIYDSDMSEETFYGIQKFFVKADRRKIASECGGVITVADWARFNIPAAGACVGNLNGFARKDSSDGAEISVFDEDEIREWLEDYVRELPESDYVEDYVPMAS